MEVSVIVRPARPHESDAVASLVARARLPTEGLEDAWRSWVAEEDGALVGTASLERYGDALLLRGVAIRPDRRGVGIGQKLVRAVLDEAAGVGTVALLTESAGMWFSRLGFKEVDRSGLDSRLLASPELQGLCPETAQAFVWEGKI
jgi:amino-acid N-acetyltransferase